MRVLIPAVSAASEISGVQRHAFNVAACLLDLAPIRSVDLVVAPWQQEMTAAHAPAPDARMRIHIATLTNTAVARNAWFYCRLPALAKELTADLVHLVYPMPVDQRAFNVPLVLSLHDLYPYDAPRNFGPIKAWFYRRVLQNCLRSANAIACVSDSTLAALKKHSVPRIWRKARRIYNSVDTPGTQATRPADLINNNEPFLLCVAQHRHNKNIAVALRSLHLLLERGGIDSRMRLLLIGIPGPETPHLRDMTVRLGICDRVIFAEGLPEPELLWCYKNCAAMIMPSTVEGFGLPAVEATLAGCRVVCSDIPALREVAGHQCYFVPLTRDPAPSFSEAILRALQRPAPAPTNLPQFAKAQIGQEYLALYEDAIVLSKNARQRCAVSTNSLLSKGHGYE